MTSGVMSLDYSVSGGHLNLVHFSFFIFFFFYKFFSLLHPALTLAFSSFFQ